MPNLEIEAKELDQWQPNTPNQRGEAIGKKAKEGKGGAKALKFTCMEMNECGPVIEEIPGNEVIVATRQINIANALGIGDWGRRNWAEGCSIIIDTGSNGGGLCRYHCLGRYVEYMRRFPHKANLVKTREKEL